jgi:DNA-binding NtrC family response regulator
MADLLIVDDDVEAADILALVLRGEGHDVRVARNGGEGMALLHARTPDLALIDVEMPVLTGPEVAQAMLVHNLGLEEVPIILCSGVLDLHRVAALVGTPYSLAKPFTVDAMLRQIERALAERISPHAKSPGSRHEA